MFDRFIGENVKVIVATKSDGFLEYCGVLDSVSDETILLKNVSINSGIFNIQKAVFGNGLTNYDVNIGNVIINKEYIISCNIK